MQAYSNPSCEAQENKDHMEEFLYGRYATMVASR